MTSRAALATTIGVLAVLAAYAPGHPLQLPHPSPLLSLLWLLPLLALATAGGAGAVKALGLTVTDPLEHRLLSLALGQVALSVGLTVLVYSHNLSAVTFVTFAAGLAASGIAIDRGALAASAPRPSPDAVGPGGGLFLGSCRALIGVILLLTLAQALTPPTAWDEFLYHLYFPLKMARSGGTIYEPDNLFSGMVQAMGMLYSGLLTLGPEELARAYHWSFLPQILLLIAALNRRFGPERSSLPAALLFAATPIVAFEATWAYLDLALAFFATACFMLLSRPSDETGWITVSALLAGMCLSLKHTALIFIPGWLLMLVRHRTGVSRLALWLAITLLVPAPWYARNLARGRGPLNPIATPGLTPRDTYERCFARDMKLKVPRVPLWRLPWDISTRGAVDTEETFDGDIGPLFLGLLPLLAIPAGGPGASLLSGWLPGLVCWALITNATARYLIPLLPVLCVLLGRRLPPAAMDGETGVLPAAVRGLVLFTCAYQVAGLVSGYSFGLALPRMLGLEPREAYLENPVNRSSRQAGLWMNRYLPDHSRILTLHGGVIQYYCERTMLLDFGCTTPVFPTAQDYFRIPVDPAAAAARLGELGVTHILIGEPALERSNRAGWSHARTFQKLRSSMQLLARFPDDLCLYQWMPAKPG